MQGWWCYKSRNITPFLTSVLSIISICSQAVRKTLDSSVIIIFSQIPFVITAHITLLLKKLKIYAEPIAWVSSCLSAMCDL